jgi:hypothetical protein
VKMTASLLLAGILQNLAAVRPLYLAIWCVVALVSGGLVYALRSRWGRTNPFYRCAVGSLLVHVVLVGLTMTVRLVVGDGGAGTGPPIHVRLVDDVQREGPITLAAPKLAAVEEQRLHLRSRKTRRKRSPWTMGRCWSLRRCSSHRHRWLK